MTITNMSYGTKKISVCDPYMYGNDQFQHGIHGIVVVHALNLRMKQLYSGKLSIPSINSSINVSIACQSVSYNHLQHACFSFNISRRHYNSNFGL